MAARSDIGLIGALIAAIVVLFVVSLAIGPILLSPATVAAGLFGHGGAAANIIVPSTTAQVRNRILRRTNKASGMIRH